MTADDTANTITGLDVATMEYSSDAGVTWSQVAAPTFAGAQTVLVRVKDDGVNGSGLETTLTFTTNPPAPAPAPAPAPVVVTSSGISAAEAAAIRAANEAAAKAEAEKIAAAKAVADAKVAAEAAAKAAADKLAAEKVAADKAAADKAEAEVRAAAEAVVKAEQEKFAAAEVKAAAVVVKPVVTKSGTKMTLDLPDKYYGKIVTIYVGTTVKGKTTYKKLDFFVLDKEDGTANITSKVKLVKGQTIQVKVGSTVVKSVKI